MRLTSKNNMFLKTVVYISILESTRAVIFQISNVYFFGEIPLIEWEELIHLSARLFSESTRYIKIELTKIKQTVRSPGRTDRDVIIILIKLIEMKCT